MTDFLTRFDDGAAVHPELRRLSLLLRSDKAETPGMHVNAHCNACLVFQLKFEVEAVKLRTHVALISAASVHLKADPTNQRRVVEFWVFCVCVRGLGLCGGLLFKLH